MSNSKPTYEELKIENERLRKLVSEKTDFDVSLPNSPTISQDKVALADLKFEATLKNMVKPFFITDIEGNVTNFNTAFSEFYRFKSKEDCVTTIHEFFTLFECCLPIGGPLTLEEWPVVRAIRGEKANNAEYRLKRIDTGEIWPCTYSFAPTVDEEGKIIGSIVSCEDITERKRIEKELIESEMQFRSIVEQSPLSIQMFTPDGVTVQVNRAYENLWGMTLEDLKAYNILEDQQLQSLGIMPYIQRAFSGEATSIPGVEYNSLESIGMGKKSWVKARIYPVKDNAGNIDKIILLHEDITESKQAEEKLKENEEKFRALYDNAPLSYQSLNEDGSFKDINPTWLRTLGYKRNEVIGKFYKDFLHPDWQTHFEDNFPKFKKRGYVNDVQFKIRHKDGHYIDISFEGCIGYHSDGSFKQTYCVFTDITERKKTENALRINEEKLNLIINLSPVGICTVDVFGNFIMTNRAYEQILGYSKEELVGLSFYDVTHPKDRPKNKKLFQDMFSLETTGFSLEKRYVRKNGKEIIVSVHADIIRDVAGMTSYGTAFIEDITERKKSEEKLRKSEEEFRQLSESMPQIVWITRADGWNIYFNQQWIDYTGLSLEESYGYNWIKPFHPDDQQAILNTWEHAVSNKITYSFESRLRQKNGTYRWSLVRGVPILDENNKIVKWFGTCTDIEENKQAQAGIIESEKRYRSLFNYSPISLWEEDITDLVSYLLEIKEKGYNDLFNYFENNPDELKKCSRLIKIVDVNQSVLDLNGTKSKKQLIENLSETFTEKSFLVFKNLLLALFKGRETFECESEFKTFQGDIKNIYMTLNIDKTQEGKVKALLAISDITDRKQAEQAMIESEERFSSAFNESPIPLNITDIETGKRIAINDKFVESFGYSRAELLSGNIFKADLLEDNKDLMEAVDRIKREGFLQDYPFRMLTKNGDLRDLLLSASRINNEYKNQFVVSMIDITKRKKAELELIKYRAHLEDLVKERTKELEAFSYSVSHDLKAPLRAVIGFSQILKEDFAPQLDSESKRYIGLIQDNAENMGNLINDLLNFSRMARAELQKSQVDLSVLVQRVKSELITEIQDRELTINVMNMPLVNVDEKLIYHVMLNLISNAVKFTSKVKNAVVEIGCNRENKKDVFYIKDNGVGFNMKYAGKIFDVFQRLHTVEEFSGTGIGLSIVQRIIHKHEGKIWVESEINKGTTFFFTL